VASPAPAGGLAAGTLPGGVAGRLPVRPTTGALGPLSLDEVRLTGGFWGERQRLNATAILPHCQKWVERRGAVDNLRGRPYRGREFADSDVYKLLEALAWESGRRGGDGRLDAIVDEVAAVLAAAQEPDGYLNSRWSGARYTDLEWGHELYCYGHLIQAGVARLRCHGEDRLTEVARRAADHVCARFAADDGICGHPEIEMALVELYRATRERRYLEQAAEFVRRRGHGRLADIEFGQAYFQDDVPVRDRRAFAGHAVREFYLACGAVDVAVETGDGELLAAIIGQWERTVAARTYLTGATGSRHEGESFGEDFELPPDRAYGETCASIASVMLSWRLLLATGQARFADLIERTMFNTVAAGVGQDGHSFFYSNPLALRRPGPPADPDLVSRRAATGSRAPWFEVSCCPPNLSRLIGSLAGYHSTVDDGGVQVHQFWSATVDTAFARVSVETDYPWSGTVSLRLSRCAARPWTLSVRVPAWAGGALLDGRPVRPGYARLERAWRDGDEVRLELPMDARFTWPDPRVDAVRGCVAVERGPMVYCAESVDPGWSSVPGVDPTRPPVPEPASEFGAQAVALRVSATAGEPPDGAWPYRSSAAGPQGDPGELRLVPYHLWANRGPAAMRVFLPVAARSGDRSPAEE
jgi:hypothetical protein